MNTNANPHESAFAALIGLDWGDRQHAIALRDCASGKTELSLLDHTAESLRSWLEALAQRFGSRPVALALETSKGPLIHAFLGLNWLTVFPIHPATSTRMRKAFTPSGAKDDIPDAQVLLELLLFHREKLRPQAPEDGPTRHLAGLCELRRKTVNQRTLVSNQLTAALKGFFPQALELIGEKLCSPMALEFLRRWPDLLSLKTARPTTLKNFYYRHNVRQPAVVEKRLALVREAKALTTDEVVVALGRQQAQCLLDLLKTLGKHIAEHERQIQALFKEHPESPLFRELPGAGRNLAPRLLVAFGTDRTRYSCAADLQRYSGLAPVKEKSCGRIWVHWRWNAPCFLRQTFIEWAGETVVYSAWAKAYYEQQKKRGKRHWTILRSLAFTWVRIIWKCWQTKTPYDENRYLQNLRNRKSSLINTELQSA